jgi:hypothetical protein
VAGLFHRHGLVGIAVHEPDRQGTDAFGDRGVGVGRRGRRDRRIVENGIGDPASMVKRTEAEDEAVSKSATADEDCGWSPYADRIDRDLTPQCLRIHWTEQLRRLVCRHLVEAN